MKSSKKISEIKNIIIVNDFDYIQGGASKVAIETANILSSNCKNINVYFFSSVHDTKSNLDDRVIKINCNQKEALKEKNKIKGSINGIYNKKVKNEFKKLLKTLNKDETIIHIHGWTKALSSSVFDVAFKMKYNVVLTMHDYFTACPNGGYFNYKTNKICKLKPLSMKCIRCNCDSRNYCFKIYRIIRQLVQVKIVKLNSKLKNVISISDFSENILKNTLNSSTKIYRINNPIDLDNNVEKVDYKKNKYFLYVGRITKEKGVDIFCKAITDMKLKGIVVGDGDQKNILENKYPNINFVGWKDSKEVKQYMKDCKALIFPSRWYEGAPLTTLEAMQFGIPCIVSDCCAAKDNIENNKNGLIFSDIDDLKKCLKNFDKYNFNVELNTKNTYLKDILECYRRILGGK